jgi:hypothetical protein
MKHLKNFLLLPSGPPTPLEQQAERLFGTLTTVVESEVENRYRKIVNWMLEEILKAQGNPEAQQRIRDHVLNLLMGVNPLRRIILFLKPTLVRFFPIFVLFDALYPMEAMCKLLDDDTVVLTDQMRTYFLLVTGRIGRPIPDPGAYPNLLAYVTTVEEAYTQVMGPTGEVIPRDMEFFFSEEEIVRSIRLALCAKKRAITSALDMWDI